MECDSASGPGPGWRLGSWLAAMADTVERRAPMGAAFSGYVPATPQHQVGEMIYQYCHIQTTSW